MYSEAQHKMNQRDRKIHKCPRHHDLSILLKTARKDICNTCFATLKKSYYNVIAGILLEYHYLHNIQKAQIELNNRTQKKINDITDALLKLQSELSEHIRKVPNDLQKQPAQHPQTPPAATIKDKKTQDKPPQNTPTTRSLAEDVGALGNLLHIGIARVLHSLRNTSRIMTPTTDDLKDKKGKTRQI